MTCGHVEHNQWSTLSSSAKINLRNLSEKHCPHMVIVARGAMGASDNQRSHKKHRPFEDRHQIDARVAANARSQRIAARTILVMDGLTGKRRKVRLAS
jgi:hypothetical protein